MESGAERKKEREKRFCVLRRLEQILRRRRRTAVERYDGEKPVESNNKRKC
jgi:hypothetical protein